MDENKKHEERSQNVIENKGSGPESGGRRRAWGKLPGSANPLTRRDWEVHLVCPGEEGGFQSAVSRKRI